MKKIVEAGSITFFVNGIIEEQGWVSREDAKELADALESQFREKFGKSHISEFYQITSVKWQLGCVLETISFGVIAGLLYKGIKDYPKFRDGLIALAKDFNSVYLYLKRKKSYHKVGIYRLHLSEKEEIAKALEYSKKKIID